MTVTLAVAGKGGVGKTTVAALLIKYLVRMQPGPILAIDADPSSNLNMLLGMELEWTVGNIREDLLQQVKGSLSAGGAAMGALAGGMTKQDFLDYEVRSSLVEGQRFDLVAMGRPEGSGCYCAVNHSLRGVIDDISRNYSFVVIDNEAGMEHLSRRTTRDVHFLFVVTDPTLRGVVAARRIAAFRHELDINIEHAYLILNKQNGPVAPPLQAALDELDLPLLGSLPRDESMAEWEMSGASLIELDDESELYEATAKMLRQLPLIPSA